MVQLPQKRNHFIQGQELPTDEQGRVSLNALHKISGAGESKKPSEWLRLSSVRELISEFAKTAENHQSGNSRFEVESMPYDPISKERGGANPGTFAHELLAISYAGWISPRFQLEVNAVFSAYKSGMIEPMYEIPQTKSEALRLAADLAEENEELKRLTEEQAPKVAFAEKVEVTPDAISVAQAAKTIGTGRKRLFALMRQAGWVTRKNEPYQSKIEAGLLDVKLSSWDHPEQGLQRCVTTLITGKGLVKLQELHSKNGGL